jgi:hypothetical protein
MRFLILASVSVFLAGAVQADSTRDVLSEIARCAGIRDSVERLKCFDTAAPRANRALAPTQAKETREVPDWFGFSRPAKPVTKAEEFGKPPPRPDEINQITATVLDLARTVRGRTIFVLDNGQTWRQLDADSTEVRDPSPGKAMRVTIETGFLDSYNLTIEGRNGLIKVRRLK